MTNKVNPIPEGYHSVTPYLGLDNASEAIAFYKKAFGARELFRLEACPGKIAHAEITIGDSHIMLADECGEIKSAKTLGGSPIALMIYVEDVDFVAKQALAAGAKTLKPVENQFYGDRSGTFLDPYGLSWTIATHVEDVSPEETKKRAEKLFGPK